MLWVSFQVLLPTSFISVSKNVIYITSKNENSRAQTGEKTELYMVPKKMIYIYKGYKSALNKTRSDEKILKIEATLI